MNKKNKRLILSLLIFGTILIGIGFSYAFFTYRNKVAYVELTMGDLSFKADIDTNSVIIGNLFPMTLEDDPYSTDNYVDFTLISNNPIDTMYATIKLKEGEDYPGKERIEDRFLHFSLKDLDNNVFIFEDIKCGLNGDIIYSTDILPSDDPLDKTVTLNYRLYAWVGDELIISDTDPDAHYKSSDDGKAYLTKFSDLFASISFEIEGAAYSLTPDTSLANSLNSLKNYFGNSRSSVSYGKVYKVIFAKTTDEYVDEYENNSILSKIVSSGAEIPVYAYVREVNSDPDHTELIFFSDNVIKLPNDCSNLFKSWANVEEYDFSNADFSDVTNLSSAFFGNQGLTSFVFPKIKNLTTLTSAFDSCTKLKYVDFSNVEKFSGYLRRTFYGCTVLEDIYWENLVVPSGNIDFDATFYNCVNLKNLHLENFDLSGGVDFYDAFYGCESLERIFFPSSDILFTSMYQMFYNCKKLNNLDFSKVNFNGTSSCDYMFYNCSSLEYVDLSGISYSSDVHPSAANMFNGCLKLKEIELGNFPSCGFSTIANMFNGCVLLRSIDFSNFNFDYFTSTNALYGTFRNCSALEYLTIKNLNSDLVLNFAYTFNGCNSLKGLGFINCNIKVSSLASAFSSCSSLLEVDFSVFNTSACASLSNTFSNCSSLAKLEFIDVDFSSLTNMSGTFTGCTGLKDVTFKNVKFNSSQTSNVTLSLSGCSSLENLYIDRVDYYSSSKFSLPSSLKKVIIKDLLMANVTSLSDAFYGLNKLAYLEVDNLDIPKCTSLYEFARSNNLVTFKFKNINGPLVTTMEGFNTGCTKLINVEIKNINLPLLTNVSSMFYNCSKLETVDMSWFEAPSLYNFNMMFYGCTSLRTIYASVNWDIHSASCASMFYNCTSLVGETGYTYVSGNNTATYATFDYYLTKKE